MPVFAYIAPVRVEPSAGSWQHKARLPRKRVTVALPAQPAPPQRPPLDAPRPPLCAPRTPLWRNNIRGAVVEQFLCETVESSSRSTLLHGLGPLK